MAKASKLLLRPRAEKDLEDIYHYSVKEFGIEKADSYILDIDNGFERILENVELGNPCSQIKKNLRSLRIGSHVIFYTIRKEGILIIRILHKSMDYSRHT